MNENSPADLLKNSAAIINRQVAAIQRFAEYFKTDKYSSISVKICLHFVVRYILKLVIKLITFCSSGQQHA